MKMRIVLLLLLFTVLTTQAQEIKDSISSVEASFLTPPYLQKGDTVAIVAPAGVLSTRRAIIDKARALAERWGLHVVYGAHLFNESGHFAGTDAERAEDFQEALNNPAIKAIWAARGGYGTVRVLDRLDFTAFKQSPKWVIGYSDITALHSHIHTLGVGTMHAMMGASLVEDPIEIVQTMSSFRKALFGERLTYSLVSLQENREGEAKGQLIGGNLAILASMLGSSSQMETTGKILFIEEVGEYKYSIDRMLQSLKRAGFFKKCTGLIIGDISNIKKNTTKWGRTIEQLILDVVAEYDFPVLFNFPAGHESDNRALILGKMIHLSVAKEGVSTVVFED